MSDISKISIELLKLREKDGDFLSDQTFITANNLVNKLYSTAKANNLWWYPPEIYRSEVDNSLVIRWWRCKNEKCYFIYVEEDDVNYTAIWGNKNRKETESGDINIENDLTEFWGWIAE